MLPYSAEFEAHTLRPDSPVRPIVVAQVVEKNADGSLRQCVRQKRDDWALADGAVAGPPPTLANFQLLENGDVRLSGSGSTLVTKAGPPTNYFTPLSRSSPINAIALTLGGTESADIEIKRIKVWLNPRVSGSSTRQVVKWKLCLMAISSEIPTLGAQILSPIYDDVLVDVLNDAEGLVTFDFSLNLGRPKAKLWLSPDGFFKFPTIYAIVYALDKDGNNASNAGMGYAAGAVTTAGTTLDSRNLVTAPLFGASQFPGIVRDNGPGAGCPIVTVDSETYTSQTISFTTNPLSLGGPPAGDVQLIARGHVPNGCAIVYKIRNDADSGWISYTDGQWMIADLGLTPSTTRKWQIDLVTNVAGGSNLTPILTGVGMESLSEVIFLRQTKVSGGNWAIDPQSLKGEIPEVVISFIRDGDKDYTSAIEDLLANNHIGDIRLRLYWGDEGLARKDWLHDDDVLIDGSHPRGPEIRLKCLSVLCLLRDLVPRFKAGSTFAPNADVSVAGWTTDAGSGVNLYQRIDETSFDDTDYIRSSLSPSNEGVEFKLPTITDPAGRRQLVDYRFRKDATSGEQIDLTVQLRQGSSTIIAAQVHTNIDTDTAFSATPFTFSLTDQQIAAITDPTDLRIRFIANKPSGSGARRAVVTWLQFRTGGKQDQVTYNGTLKSVYDGLMANELGVDARYRGNGIEDTQSINQVGKTMFQSAGASNKPLGKAELDALAYIAGGGLTTQQGKITFANMFSPGPVRAIFPSSEISLDEAGPGYEERMPQLFATWKWNASKGDFDRQEYVVHAGALLHLGQARLDPAKWFDVEMAKWLQNEGLDSNGVSLAGRIGVRQVQAIGPGLMLWPFVANYRHPWLRPGDVIQLQTNKFVGRDPSVSRAIRGQQWVTAVIQSRDASARHFSAWVRNYSDMLAAVQTGDRNGLGPVTPQITALVTRVDDAGNSWAGIKAIAATAVRWAVSKVSMPSDATVRAAALVALDASGVIFTGNAFTGGVPGDTVYWKAFAYEKADGSGLESLAATTTSYFPPRNRNFPRDDGKYDVQAADNAGLQVVKAAQIEGQVRKLSSALTYLIPNAELEVWESASQPHGWSVDTTGGATVAKETTAANIFSGDAALKYTDPDNASAGGWHGVSTNEGAIGAFCVALRPGGSYTLRIGSRASRAGLGQQYRARLSFNAAETSTFTKAWTYKAASTYQLDIVTFTVPTTAEKNAKLYIEFNRNGDATSTDFWLDSIRVDELVDRLFFDNGDVTGTVTIDWAVAPTQRIRLIGNTTLVFINGRPGNRYVLDAAQDGTGGRTLTFPANTSFDADTPPTITSTADKMCNYAFEVVGDLVTIYRGKEQNVNVTSWDVKSATFDFEVNAGMALNSTFAITGLGFQPKLIVLWWSGRTETSGDAAGQETYQGGWGAASSTSSRWAHSYKSNHNVAASTNGGSGDTASVMIEIDETTTSAIVGKLDVNSFDSGGVTFKVTAVFQNTQHIMGIAIGGLTFKAKVGTFTETATVGDQAYTGVGFKPTGLLMGKVLVVGATDFSAPTRIGFGSGLGAIGIAATRELNGGSPTNCRGYNQHLEIGARGADTIGSYATLKSFDTDGFTLTWTAPSTGAVTGYVAVAGCKCKNLNFNTRTDTTNDIVVSGLGLQPRAAIFGSACRAESTDLTMSSPLMFSMGAFSWDAAGGTPTQRATCIYAKHAVTTTICGTGASFRHAYYSLSDTGGSEGSAVGKMKVTSVDAAGGFTARMDVADAVAAQVVGLAIGI